MKKWIAGLLTAALLAGIAPAVLADEPAAQAEATFKAGYGAANVTPDLTSGVEIHIAGNFDTKDRIATQVADDETGSLWMKAIALSDGTNTKVVMTTDFIRVPIGWNEIVEEIILDEGDQAKWNEKFAYLWTDYTDTTVNGETERTGVVNETLKAKWLSRLPDYTGKAAQYGLNRDETGGFLSISGTHTHSSVDIGDGRTSKNVSQDTKWHTSNKNNIVGQNNKAKDTETSYFHDYWLKGALDAVLAALGDLEPAEIQTKSAQLNSVNVSNVERRTSMVRHWFYSDGTMAGVNFGNTGGSAKGHFREPDPELQMIRFVRSGADDDIILLNWQTHPTVYMSKTNRTNTTEDGVKNTYYMLSSDYCGALCHYLTETVADCQGVAYFQGAAGNVNPASSTGGGQSHNQYYHNYGRRLGEKAAQALEDMETLPAGAVQMLRNDTVVVERGYEEYRTIQQDVITVGDAVAFVSAGYEMFDSNAMDVKKATKAEFTDVRDGVTTTNEGGYGVVFVIENSQGHEYMPNWQTSHYTLLGGPEAYEVRSGSTNVVPGTAEDLADGLIYMLQTLNPDLPE